VAPALVPSQTL